MRRSNSILAVCFSLSFWLCGGPYSLGQEKEVDSPLPAEEAARTMVVPDGFHVTLFAGEPDIRQPIGFCIDDRGRLWVAEAYNYPNHGTKPGDRIVILEDTNGDGKSDKRTVFFDQLNYVTGIEVGFGGAWVMSPPFFYFIPDRDGDGRPDGQPKILLDGFGNHANAHNLANGFAWGPDGWLYGTHGRTNWSVLGKPGTPDNQRIRFDGGVFRYHPIRHEWEPFADGTTNPWGIDWNDVGEGFMCNCVNPHLFHVIQGAHYEPWRDRESSQYAYDRIATIADHLHFTGLGNVRDGLGTPEEDEAGGGHAHCGTMIYLGDNWPDSYRNSVFMNNIHGHRINNDILHKVGSGYSASHGRDVMRSRDPWYMGVTLQYGPDGAVFASDWSDTGECHSVKNTRRETGRVYKIAFGNTSSKEVDVAQLSDAQLVQLQLHHNDWHVRHARRNLQERAASGSDMKSIHKSLRAMFVEQADVSRKLRALWALHVTNGLDDALLVDQLDHSSEHVRSWAIQLLCEDGDPPPAALNKFQELAVNDPSAFVRRYLASALQRLDPKQRWAIAERLITHEEDNTDANMPFMNWYAIEPLITHDIHRFVSLAAVAKTPLVRRNIARRASSVAEDGRALVLLLDVLKTATENGLQRDLLTGMLQGLEGRRSVKMPPNWPAAYAILNESATESVREQALQLALIFDDPLALKKLASIATDGRAAADNRNKAIHALVAKRPADLAPVLLDLILDPATRSSALKGVAEYDHPATVARILDNYSSFDAAARQDALQTLSSRPAWAVAMLDAVEARQIPVADLTAYTARQVQSLGDPRLTARLETLWGALRATPADKGQLIARYKRQLTPESLARANRAVGRAVFDKTCANCHRLFDAGGSIGPDITGAQRRNMDYLLENLVDPSATVAREYQMQVIETVSGRIVTGILIAETRSAITIQTVNEKLVIPANEIENRSSSRVSMMPDGMLQSLTSSQVRDLIAYLSGSTQVSPLLSSGLQ